jgi:hypothetical protein
MLENYLIDCCAPTLASLKSGSLFSCKCPEGACIEEIVDRWNAGFSELGITMCILRRTEKTALICVYRGTSLARTLKDPEVQAFLGAYGYESCSCCDGCSTAECSITSCLEHLRDRIAMSNTSENIGAGSGGNGYEAACGSNTNCDMKFPHEIGVFLGYPLQDVKGFIENNGRNSKYTGLWKVYGDKAASIRMFEKYRKCFSVYSDLWRSGRRDIFQLTVAG